jgi:hypothetical protein
MASEGSVCSTGTPMRSSSALRSFGLNTKAALTMASATRCSPACVMRKNRSFCWRGP